MRAAFRSLREESSCVLTMSTMIMIWLMITPMVPIQVFLIQFKAMKIIFLITHRLSTIRNADQIAFLEDGRIVEIGSHDELTRLENGRYRAFVETETVETSL